MLKFTTKTVVNEILSTYQHDIVIVIDWNWCSCNINIGFNCFDNEQVG